MDGYTGGEARVMRFNALLIVLVGALAWVSAGSADEPSDPVADGAAGAPPAVGEAAPALDVATILSEIADEDRYRETTNCLRVRSYDSVEIVDDRHLLFRGDDKVWLNTLRHRCGYLRDDMVLVFERTGSQLCDTDRVSGRDRFQSAYYGSCMLGTFELIDEQQAIALKDALEAARHTPRHDKQANEEAG